MTWHQWHHTASRSRITKRFSAVARVNRSSLQSLHLGPSAASDGDAASAARAKAAMRTSFMTSPGAGWFGQLRAGKKTGLSFSAMSRECETAKKDNHAQVDSL